MPETVKIYYWPSGDWCWEEELDAFLCTMSDDYTVADIDIDWTYEDIDTYVFQKI